MDDEAAAQDGPRSAKPWLKAIDEASKVMDEWQKKAENVEKLYANLKTLSGGSGDREFQIFWANLEVLKPTIYSRPPLPVVTPRFRDRKPLPRRAADLLERALITDVEMDDLHTTLQHVRDDLALCGRGTPWVRDFDGQAAPTAEHVDREDFLHEPARKWREVGWVARRAWLGRDQAEERFGEEMAFKLEYNEQSHGTDDDTKLSGGKAAVWEIWSKDERSVIWVSPGCDVELDRQDPWLNLEGFFPCPRPAYGTLQPRTMIPVPDFLYYKDQVEEINELTLRIGALAEALKLKGLYPSGQDDIAEALKRAFGHDSTDNVELVGVSNFAQLGGVSLKDSIVWLPVREVAEVIAQLVELRRQMIDDVYQITGLSDIMRGSTEASETATAQQLKSEYGSIRVRSRQEEMARIARDVIRIKAEIMAESVDPQVLLDMSQVDDLPSQAEVQQQAAQMQAQMAQVPPEQAQAMQGQMQTLQNTVTLEAVFGLLRNQRLRPFILDIETDSTIQPNEDAEKQRRTEFVTAIGGLMQQAFPMVAQAPELGPFVGEVVKFTASGFRAGRQMDTAIDEMVEAIGQRAAQPQANPEAEAAQAEAQAKQAEMQMQAQIKQAEMQMKQAEMQIKAQEAQARAQSDMVKAEADRERMQFEAQVKAAEVQMNQQETAARVQLIDAQIEKIMAEIGRIRTEQARQPQEATNGND